MDSAASSDPGPDVDLIRVEASAQLWDAAGGLQPRDQEVLELHIRHGLMGQALAESLGVSESHANVMPSRMRDRMGSALGSLLVAQQGRDECDQLDMLLAGWDGRFTLETRGRVNRHVKACDICERTRATAIASGVSFGILPIIPAPSFLRARTIDAMSASISTGQPAMTRSSRLLSKKPTLDRVAEWDWAADGFPGNEPGDGGRPGVLLVAAAVFTIATLLGGTIYALTNTGSDVLTDVAGVSELADPNSTTLPANTSFSEQTTTTGSAPTSVASASGSDDAELRDTTTAPTPTKVAASESSSVSVLGASTTTASTTSGQPTTTTPETTTSQTSTSVTSTTQQSTTTETTTTLQQTTSSSSTTETTTSSSTSSSTPLPPNEPPVISLAVLRPIQVEVEHPECAGQPALLAVEATDSDGMIVSVVARWSATGTDSTTTALEALNGGPLYRGPLGPWAVEGSQTVSVVVTDDLGGTATTQLELNVIGCIADDGRQPDGIVHG